MAVHREKLDQIYKIALLGDPLVGKTTFLSKYIPNPKTLNKTKLNDMESKVEVLGSRKVEIQVWDLSGSPLYRAVSDIYFKKAFGAFIFFDVANQSSFSSVESWIRDLRSVNPNCKIMIIGNKADLRGKVSNAHCVSTQEADSLALKVEVPYKELSSFRDEEVLMAFKEMIGRIDDERGVETGGNLWVFVLFVVVLVIGLAFFMF